MAVESCLLDCYALLAGKTVTVSSPMQWEDDLLCLWPWSLYCPINEIFQDEFCMCVTAIYK